MDMFPQQLTGEGVLLQLERTSSPDPAKPWKLPAGHYAICDKQGQKMGKCDLRIGHNQNVYYGGNIGYRVEEPYRGHRYAAKACRVLFRLAKELGMDYLIISCTPDNTPSRKTCEILGGELLEIAELPSDNDMRVDRGLTHVCVFRFAL